LVDRIDSTIWLKKQNKLLPGCSFVGSFVGPVKKFRLTEWLTNMAVFYQQTG
jgi:hypothetical protein